MCFAFPVHSFCVQILLLEFEHVKKRVTQQEICILKCLYQPYAFSLLMRFSCWTYGQMFRRTSSSDSLLIGMIISMEISILLDMSLYMWLSKEGYLSEMFF